MPRSRTTSAANYHDGPSMTFTDTHWAIQNPFQQFTAAGTVFGNDFTVGPWITASGNVIAPSDMPAGGRKTAAAILAESQSEVQELLSKLTPPGKMHLDGLPEVPAGYFELAERIGLRSRTLLTARVQNILQREELVVYPEREVKDYLDSICKALTKVAGPKKPAGWGSQGAVVWRWAPLMLKDWGHQCDRGALVYSEVLPIEALRIMDRVNTAFEKDGVDRQQYAWEVTEVSEYPDPFLALVSVNKSSMQPDARWVLFHWDEPGFTIVK